MKAYREQITYWCWECGADMSDEVTSPDMDDLECKACRDKRKEEEAEEDA